MNGSVVTGWLARIFGYGMAIATPWISQRFGPEAATAAAAVGAVVLNKASTFIVPKVEHYVPKALQR
jgi:hypothetical protein